MNVTKCNEKKCEIKYQVLIHSSRNTLNNDLHSTDPIITIGTKVKKTAEISKINMDSISTETNPCATNEKLTRIDCQIDKVTGHNKNSVIKHSFDIEIFVCIISSTMFTNSNHTIQNSRPMN